MPFVKANDLTVHYDLAGPAELAGARLAHIPTLERPEKLTELVSGLCRAGGVWR